MQVLAEEIISFLKLAINLDIFYNKQDELNIIHKKIIELTLFETHEYFLVNSNKNSLTTININSYIEFFGRIQKISGLKSINSIINFVCSSCGVIYSRNCEHVRNHKTLNSYFMNTDKNFHCQNSENPEDMINHRISKEYSNLKIIRFFQ